MPESDKTPLVTQLKRLCDRDQRLFACWCVRKTPLHDGRTTWDLLTNECLKNAVQIAEKYAQGKATKDELEAARVPAAIGLQYAAAKTAAGGAAWKVARAATDVAATGATAAEYATAVGGYLREAAGFDAGSSDAWAVARAAQERKLRDIAARARLTGG